MPNLIIEGMREKLIASNYIPSEVKKQRSLNRFNRSFNQKPKEESIMSNPFTTPGGASPVGMTPGAMTPGGMTPGGMTPGATGMAPGGAGPNVARHRQDKIEAAAKKGLSFRPKGLIVDGEQVERLVFDTDNQELVAFINSWKSKPENQKTDEVTGLTKPKTINSLRAVKEICAETGQSPRDFALVDDKGQIVTETKKPSTKGFIITFPATESGDTETTEIIKKQDLMLAISNKGGFSLAGSYVESSLNPDKLDIPVALTLTPTKRKSKDNAGESVTTSIRIAGAVDSEKKKELFPDKNNVGLYDIFARFPHGAYQVERIVPLKLYETEMIDGRRVAKLDISPEKKLAQYKAIENELVAGAQGAELMEKLGIPATRLQAAFSRKASSALETETDLVSLITKSFTSVDAGPDVQKYINSIQ